MDKRIDELSLEEFIKELGKADSVLGGGSAAAVAAAMSSALIQKVAGISVKNKKYEAYKEINEMIEKEFKTNAPHILMIAQRDVLDFAPLSAAYHMPGNTPEEKKERDEQIARVSARASLPPVSIIQYALLQLIALDALMKTGSKLLLADIGLSAQLLLAASEGAWMNILTNLKSMPECEEKEEIFTKTEGAIEEIRSSVEEIKTAVLKELTN